MLGRAGLGVGLELGGAGENHLASRGVDGVVCLEHLRSADGGGSGGGGRRHVFFVVVGGVHVYCADLGTDDEGGENLKKKL